MSTRRAVGAAAAALATVLACAAPVDQDAPPAGDDRQIVGRGADKEQWWDALPRPAWARFRQVAQSQPWFEVYEIRPRVFAIYEPGQFEEVISYLIVGEERALVFDTGLGIGNMRRLVEELLTGLPDGPREVVALNSHTHYDHVGGNHAFDEIYGTGLDYTRANASGRDPDEVAEFVGEGWIWKPTPSGFSPATFRSRPFTISRQVADGDVVSLGSVELEILLTPGHAPDALCLLDRRRRLLFTGDTLYPATLYAHLPGSDLDAYEATAERLAALAGEVDLVLPAHNEPVMAPADLVALRDGFRAIDAGSAEYVGTDGSREYDFGRFSILVPDRDD